MSPRKPSRKAGPVEPETAEAQGSGSGNEPYPLPHFSGMILRDRSTAYVLDASAYLAMLHGEMGGDLVALVLEHCIMSAVNWAEVAQKAMEKGVPVEGMRQEVQALGLEILSFTPEDAERAASLREPTRSVGLSLGDRACLALAQRRGIPTLTADRAWGRLRLTGVEIQLLR